MFLYISFPEREEEDMVSNRENGNELMESVIGASGIIVKCPVIGPEPSIRNRD